MTRSTGFTLVELMVVVTVIVILSGLLTVGLSRAEKEARRVQCANHLRMIGSAIIGYANKGGGFLPNMGFREQWESLPGMQNLAKAINIRVSDSWVWDIDFVKEEDRYFARQDQDKILPPRMAPDLFRCPSDVLFSVNGQSIVTSYWTHFYNSYRPYSTIAKRDVTPLAFEADALNEVGRESCGCRFATVFSPKELDTTHYGGAHILFCDGSVRLYTRPADRKIEYWEKVGGFKDDGGNWIERVQ